jgi:hypothetical protein
MKSKDEMTEAATPRPIKMNPIYRTIWGSSSIRDKLGVAL